jgi:6-phosphogluconolactonase (cycloisomerase 2 family)
MPEQLYIQTNSAENNEIAVFTRTAGGTLLPAGRFRTDGFGTGVPLAVDFALSNSQGVDSQGSVALSGDREFLFAVNAGSHDISSFAFVNGGLRLVGKVPSGGPGPVSIAVHGSLLYVANKFGRGEITGFRIEPEGQLSPLEGSQRPLSGPGAVAAQLSFTPDGRFLVLTERTTDRIVTYRVNSDGRTGRARSVASSGATPYGFGFDASGRLLVSEAFGGTPQASAMSSYSLGSTGEAAVISASVATHQTSACWVATTGDGRYVYTSNTANPTINGTISGYRIDAHGNLSLLDVDGRTADTGLATFPADLAISADDRHLYVLLTGSQAIGVFALQRDGSLVSQPYVGGVPSSAAGMVIR